jgi:hypothetical protein
MASFLARALNLPAATADFFTDDAGSIHEADINRIAEAGITTGLGGGSVRATGRADAIAIKENRTKALSEAPRLAEGPNKESRP